MFRSRIVLASAVAVLLAAGAIMAAVVPTTTTAGSTTKVGLITKFPVAFYFSLVSGAKAWLHSAKNVQILYGQGVSATDDAGEIAAIQDMIAQGVKGIAITPVSASEIPALTAAVHDGIKVVLLDNDLPTFTLKSSVIATDNLEGGILAGRYLATRLKPGDTLGILEGVPGVPALDDRVSGMLTGLGALKPKIKVVSELETDCDQTKGEQAAQTILTANPHLTAIYSACGPPALGAIQAIKHAGIKPGGIILVGFDGLQQEIQAVKAGIETATVQQHPFAEGYDGLATLLDAIDGRPVPRFVNTGTGIITRAHAG
jgi:ABC-type sugar transport system substrate-binding protein